MKRGGSVTRALSVAEARAAVHLSAAALRSSIYGRDGNGLDASTPCARRENTRIVLTGYGAIATAVAAVKMGASIIWQSPPMPMMTRACCRMAKRCRPARGADVGGSRALGNTYPAGI